MVLELNASDDRGIGVVRKEIKNFIEMRGLGKKKYFKLVVLDESDSMTKEAQSALRRMIEIHTKNARFCFICNHTRKIIPALLSRCTRFRFAALSKNQICRRVNQISYNENIVIDSTG